MPTPAEARLILQMAQELALAVEQENLVVLERLVEAYARLSSRLQADLVRAAEQAARTGATGGTLARTRRASQLLGQVADEMGRLSTITGQELEATIAANLMAGGATAEELATLGGDLFGVTASFNRLDTRLVQTVLGFTQPGGPLYQRLEMLSPWTVDQVTQVLETGIAAGYSPIKIAGMLEGALGQGLSAALQLVRTAQLWSYRESSRANWVANPNLVGSWVWYAELDANTCMSCVAMHGSVHSLDEPLDDHHNGRCTMVPVPPGVDPAELTDNADGQAWFNNLDEQSQREMMGPGAYDAWREGKFDLPSFTRPYEDAVYTQMRGEATLEQLLAGDESVL